MRAEDLRALLPAYGQPLDAPLTLINRSENSTWRAGGVILRVHRQGYHSAAEIASELAWLGALQAVESLRCVRPVPDRAGQFIQNLHGRHIVAFAPIDGRELLPGEDLSARFADLGRICARLHAHSRAWPRPRGFVRKRWDIPAILGPAPHWGDWRAAPGLDSAGKAVLARLAGSLTRILQAYGTTPARFGLIHADLRLANLLADPSGLWAIDFDDCGFGWWMYDFAAAVSFMETDPRLPELAARWCEGYRATGTLAPEDQAILPAMVLLRRLLLTAWIGSRADSDTARDLGGAGFTAGTVTLADRFLQRGPAGFFTG